MKNDKIDEWNESTEEIASMINTAMNKLTDVTRSTWNPDFTLEDCENLLIQRLGETNAYLTVLQERQHELEKTQHEVQKQKEELNYLYDESQNAICKFDNDADHYHETKTKYQKLIKTINQRRKQIEDEKNNFEKKLENVHTKLELLEKCSNMYYPVLSTSDYIKNNKLHKSSITVSEQQDETWNQLYRLFDWNVDSITKETLSDLKDTNTTNADIKKLKPKLAVSNSRSSGIINQFKYMLESGHISSLWNRSEIHASSCHSHVKGLGVNSNLEIESSLVCGLVGQHESRISLALIEDLILSQKFSGRAILLAGPPGTGKTALALGLCKALGTKIPFCTVSPAELYSQEVKKTEVLNEYLRRVTRVRIKVTKHIYEGELIDLHLEESREFPNQSSNIITAIVVTLKAAAGTLTAKFPPSIHKEFIREKINIGDVVHIQAESCLVRRVGAFNSNHSAIDLEFDNFVPLPTGQVYKKREIVQDLTLHDLDRANGQPTSMGELSSILSSLQAPKKTEITNKLRAEVDKMVQNYVEEGNCEIIPGVLFIDEAHNLDIHCFAYLHKIIESANSPTIILATNKGMEPVNDPYNNHKSSNELSPHGIPFDFLDRCLIIPTNPITIEDAIEIIQIRANEENTKLEPEALSKLAEICVKTSLRHAIQMLSPALMAAKIRGSEIVDLSDVLNVTNLFSSAEESVQFLKNN
uniref:RuvB-like helicase n=1 Tax=Dermatophagoides pteronyssinus TaxID=6956 RepID=A0A6P6XJL9_DERPT|nr:ruvB-like protein 1 [Dermatophagoides pteronyssinus]